VLIEQMRQRIEPVTRVAENTQRMESIYVAVGQDPE